MAACVGFCLKPVGVLLVLTPSVIILSFLPFIAYRNAAAAAWIITFACRFILRLAIKDERRVPVDARFVVTRTRDGGKRFGLLSAGLPPAPAYDLVYRHGLAVDSTGTRLAMGSTTGGLWISEDAGDSWQCVSLNLPPISAVRFAE